MSKERDDSDLIKQLEYHNRMISPEEREAHKKAGTEPETNRDLTPEERDEYKKAKRRFRKKLASAVEDEDDLEVEMATPMM